MMKIEYNKLVRDNIPSIIESNGQVPCFYILDDNEFSVALRHKLVEEANEFLESGDVLELADVLQVIKSYLETVDTSLDSLESICRRKETECGSFKHRYFLRHVIEE